MGTFLNVAFYQFFKPSVDLTSTRDLLHHRMQESGIKGSILLSHEGINAMFCGPEAKTKDFLSFLVERMALKTLDLKLSYSDTMSFKRSLVKIKATIVPTPGSTAIDPTKDTAPYISPEEFHQWLAQNKKMIVLDTRNTYEYEAGRFKNSVHLGTKNFGQFEKDLTHAPQDWRDTPIVTFCTGGIRCEKAAPLMRKKGFAEVYQLQGGILNYFKKVGQGFFEGDCFVFDERRGVKAEHS